MAQYGMPDMSGLDPDQLQQLFAMASMGGMPGMMPPPPMPHPAAAPGMEQAMQAYGTMLQYLQQQQQQAGGRAPDPFGFPAGMPGMPMPPMPGLGQYQPAMPLPQQSPTVSVSVEGMKFQYQLTEDDLHKVFCRYGRVEKVIVDEACSAAQVTFGTMQDAQSAITDLDGKVLNGLDGTLRIKWLNNQPAAGMNPYGGMNPGMSLPGFPQPLGFGGVPPMPGMPGGGGGGGYGASADGRGGAGTKGARKFTCRFLIGIDNDKEFQVARRLIGPKGANMKKIVQQTEAKLRLRGVGSGYFEGSGQKESSEPLQLCISCTNSEGYKTAVRLTEELLKKVHDEYRQFCHDKMLPVPDLQINLSENAIMTSPRGGQASGPGPGYGGGGDMDSPKKDARRGKGAPGAKKKFPATAEASGERGQPGPNAPSPEEITGSINDRNEARRSCNFAEADRIRDLLHSQGVALMDEPGARGKGGDVTTWRYWHD